MVEIDHTKESQRLRARPSHLPTELHRVPWRGQKRRPRKGVPVAGQSPEEDATGRGREDHRRRQGRDAGLSGVVRAGAQGAAVVSLQRQAVRSDDDEPMAPGVPYTHTGYNRFLDPEGYPAVKPPWGTMNAIDLNAGTIAWQVPLGEEPALVARGRRHTGTENYGGPIVTAGGLLFIGATKDEKFRALDKRTGAGAVGDAVAGGRLRHAEHVHGQRQAVRRDCRRRGEDGDQVGRRVRRVRVAGLGRAREGHRRAVRARQRHEVTHPVGDSAPAYCLEPVSSKRATPCRCSTQTLLRVDRDTWLRLSTPGWPGARLSA